MPSLELEGCQIDLVENMKILGGMISSDMKCSKNTQYFIKKLIEEYGCSKQARSDLELAVPVWQPSLTISDKKQLRMCTEMCP